MIVFSSSSGTGMESKIQSWIDNKDKTLLEHDNKTQKDVEICLRLLEQYREIAFTSFGLKPPSYQPPEMPSTDDSKNLETSPTDLSADESRCIVAPEKKRFTNPKWIGTGAFGVIYAAHDRQLNIPVAIKLLRPSKSHSTDARERFFSEAEITARLHHPNIIRIYDSGTVEKLPYITSAYSELGSLANWLEPSKQKSHSSPMSAKQAAWFVSQIAEAIQYAHSRLTLHRDLKPGNILLFPTSDTSSENLGFQPVVTDFGLSKKLETPADKNLTQVGGILGTPRYMSPEQAIGRTDQIRTTTDIYSIGVILYELLTNQLPFDGSDDEKVRQAVISAEAIPPSVIHSGLHKDLDAIVLKCLARAPEDRYQTAQELSADLKRYLNGDPVLARRTNWGRTLALAIRRYPIATGLLAMLVTVSSFAAISMYRARANEKQLTAWALRNSARVGSAFGDYILEGTRLTSDHLLNVIEPEIEALERQRSKNRGNNDLLRTLSILHHYASVCKNKNRDTTAAISERQRVIDLQMELLKLEPDNQLLRFQLATSYFWLAIINNDNLKNHTTSLVHLKESEKLLDEILRLDPHNIDAADVRNAVYVHKGDALAALSETESAKALKQKAIASSIELFERVPSKPMLATQAIYGMLSLADLHEKSGEIETSEHFFQSASDLAERCFEKFWSEGWPVRESFHVFRYWALFELRQGRNKEALAVIDRWETWYETCHQYVSVDGSPFLSSKESGRLTILCLKVLANRKLGETVLTLPYTARIRNMLHDMHEQQHQIESLRSFFQSIDGNFDLNDYLD
jgi:serine/threonine protein kinase